MNQTRIISMAGSTAEGVGHVTRQFRVIEESNWRWSVNLTCAKCHKEFNTVVKAINDIWSISNNKKFCTSCETKKS